MATVWRSEVKGHRVDSVWQEQKKKTNKNENRNFRASPVTTLSEERGKTSSSLASTVFPDVVARGQRSKIKVQGCGRFPPPKLGAARRCEHSSPEGGAGEHGAPRSGPRGLILAALSYGADGREVFFLCARSSATLVATKKILPASNAADGENKSES